jgi:hypothetical protein
VQGFNEDSLRADIVATWGPAGAHVDVFDHLVRLARVGFAGGPGPIESEWLPVDGSVIRIDGVLWCCQGRSWVSLDEDVSLSVDAPWWRKGMLVADPRWASK